MQVRLPTDASDDVDEDPTGNKALWDRGLLNGATQKVEAVVNFHVGEVITSLQKTTLIPGGSESLVYTTLSGGVGMLVPFISNEVHYYCFVYCSVHSISHAGLITDLLMGFSPYIEAKLCMKS